MTSESLYNTHTYTYIYTHTHVCMDIYTHIYIFFHTQRHTLTIIYKYIYIYCHPRRKFDIVAGVLQGDTLALYLFIICQNYVLRTSIDKMKENGFKLTKKSSRRYPAKTITDDDYADVIAILLNAPAQVETQVYSLERATAGIGLHVNAH